MNDYAKASRGVNRGNAGGSPVPMSPPGRCCAPGCQLPASMSDSTTGSNDWYCRLHFNVDYASRGGITAKASNRMGAYRLAFRCMNAPLATRVPPQVRSLLEQLGRSDLLEGATPLKEGLPLTVRALGMHMVSVLDQECRGEGHSAPAATKAESYDSWVSAGALAREEVAA